MQLKVFFKDDCPNCPAAKEVALQFPFSELFDIEEPDGLAEASYFSVLSVPSLVLLDDNEVVVQSWFGRVPRPSEIENIA